MRFHNFRQNTPNDIGYITTTTTTPNFQYFIIFLMIFFAEPKKDKTEGASQNGAVSPSAETPSHMGQPPGHGDGIGKLERPNTLAPGKLTRRLLCYHSEHCKFPIVLTNESRLASTEIKSTA